MCKAVRDNRSGTALRDCDPAVLHEAARYANMRLKMAMRTTTGEPIKHVYARLHISSVRLQFEDIVALQAAG